MPTETETSLIKQVLAKYSSSATSSPQESAVTDPTISSDDLRLRAREIAAQEGIDPDLYDSLIRNESAYDPQAISSAGALGLAQLMPETAAQLGVDPNDPIQNLTGGARYYRYLHDKYGGDATKALAAYNAGEGNVDRYGGVPPFKETQDYVRRVLGGRTPKPNPVSLKPSTAPPIQTSPSDGLPEWVPQVSDTGEQMDPISRRLISRLGPPPPPPPDPFSQRELTPREAGAVPIAPEAAAPSKMPEFPPSEPWQEEQTVQQGQTPLNPEAPIIPGQPYSLGDYIRSGALSFTKSLVEVPVGLFRSIAIGAREIDSLFGNKKELDQYATGYIAKKIEEIAKENFPDDKIMQDSFLGHTLPSFLGIGTGFVAGGALGELGGIGSKALPTLMGTGMFGAQGYQEAKQAGVGEDKALASFLLNAGLGAVEVGWVSRMLGRLDADTGGVFRQALIQSGKTSLDAALNVAIQQTGSNAVAKWIYDNQRELLHGVGGAGAAGGISGGILAFLTTMLSGAFGGRTRILAGADTPNKDQVIKSEASGDEGVMPGQVPHGAKGEIPTAPELPPGPPIGPMPEEQRLPPIEPSGRWTTETMDEARSWIPWITEGEIRSSSDIPGLIEVAKNRMQAYKENILISQATPEELALLNKPGAPRLLLLRLIEERLAKRPPGPAAPAPEVPIEKALPPRPPVQADEKPGRAPVVTSEEYGQSIDTLKKLLQAEKTAEAPVPRETPQPPVRRFGAVDPDFEAIAQHAKASEFSKGERFTGIDGHDYEVLEKTKAGISVRGPAGGSFDIPSEESIPHVDRFIPGAGGLTSAMAVPEEPAASPAQGDAYSQASPEIRQALLKAGIFLFNRGTRDIEGLTKILTKELGQGVAAYVPGLYNKLTKLPAFGGQKGVPSTQEVARGRPAGPAAGPAIPAGQEPRRGPGASKVPGPERPTEPGKRPVEGGAKGKTEEIPAKGQKRLTREIREGGIATISRELLPKLGPNEAAEFFPKHEIDSLSQKLGKRPLAHQIENAVRALKAFGFHLAGKGIPDARADNLNHAFLIADGTGTGKTLSAGLILHQFFQREPKSKILVVVKNEDLAKQWVSDVAGPMGLRTNLVSRESPLRTSERTVNFITYKRMELAWTEKTLAEIEKFSPDLLLLDESQALKNWIPGMKSNQVVVKTAAASEAASRFSKNTLYMSATPFESVLHTAYLTMTKLWHPKIEWKQWLQDKLGLTFKDGYWSGLSPKKLARFHELMVKEGRMVKSEIDYHNLRNTAGDKITLATENIKVPPSEEQTKEYQRIGSVFDDLLEDREVKSSFYKKRLVRSMRYLVFRSLDEEMKLPRAIELAKQARAEGKTVVLTLFRKNDTDLAQWWSNVQEGRRGSGQGKGYGPKSFMPSLIQYLAANQIQIASPVKILQKAFPDFVPITGDEPAGGAVRGKNIDMLMKGEAPGAILTMAAGGTGLSLHDTNGKFPRAQINISTPDTAGTMIQVAGRTFRLGSESSTRMFWLFGDSPTEGKLASKIAWRLREMGALVVGQTENPTADEIERFDFPEDPAREAEELAAQMALSGGGEEKKTAPAVFLGWTGGDYRIGNRVITTPRSEVWHPTEQIPGLAEGSTTSRQTLEKLGYHVPEPPQEPAGQEKGNLSPIELEIEARKALLAGEAPDIYEARRRVLANQTAEMAPSPVERREEERFGPTQSDIEAHAKRLVETGQEESIHTAMPRAETELGKLWHESDREAAYNAVKDIGGTEREAGNLFGWQISKLGNLSGAERTEFARTVINAMRARGAAASEGAPPIPARSDTAANYGFLPHLHRQPQPGGTITELKSMREMNDALMKTLETRKAVGWFRPKGGKGARVLAHFELWRNLVRTKIYHDVEVTAHEAGHRLDQLFFPQHPSKGLGSATAPELSSYKAELLKIATQAKPGQSRVPEGFAEFVRFYLTNAEQAKKAAPNFYSYFEDTMKDRLPKIHDAFLGIRADWENMMNADPVAAIKTTIVSGAVSGGRVPKDYYPAKMYEAVVDEMAVIRNARDHLMKLGEQWDEKKELVASADPAILASTYVAWPDLVESWVKDGQYSWNEPGRKLGPSLMEIFKPVGKNLMDYEAYAKAFEALHDLKTKGWDPWEKYGIYESWAKDAVRRLGPKYEKVRQGMVDFYSNIVDTWVQSGLMTPDLAKKMRSKNGVYSPMWRVAIDRLIEDFDQPGLPGKRLGNLPTVTFTRRGSRLETIPSIEAAYKMLMVTFKRAEENSIAAGLVKLAESVPSGGRDVAAVVPEPLRPIFVTPKEVLGKAALPKEVLEEIDPEVLNQAIPIFRPSPFKPKGPHAWVWMDGKRVFVEFDPEIYKALHFMGRHDFGVLDKMLSPFVNALRAGAITLSPGFHLRSFIKDPWTALIQSENPVLHAAYLVPSVVSALFHGEAMQRYKRSGGGVSTFLGTKPEDIAAVANRELQKRYDPKRYWGNPKNWAHEVFGIMSYLGLALEYAPRIAEARVKGLMTAKTRSEFLQAGYAGRNATVDFNMMGGFSRSMTRTAAFFGVGVSGMARMMREVKNKPLSSAIKLSVFGLMPVLYYYLHVRNDERWSRIPQRERDNNFIFWLPGMEEPMRIPKPHEWGMVMTLFERIMEAKDKENPEVLTKLTGNIVRSLPDPVPTGLMLGWELAANYSQYLGRQISPTRGEPGEQYWNYTTETSKGIGRLLGISPAKVDYGLRQVTGGLYNRWVPLAEEKLGVKPPQASLESETENPIYGTLFRRYPGQSSEAMNRFYEDFWIPASQVYESFTGKRKREPGDLKRYLGQRSQYLAIYYALRGVEGTLTELRDARAAVLASGAPDDEKRKKLEKINKTMDQIATHGNALAGGILKHKSQLVAQPGGIQ